MVEKTTNLDDHRGMTAQRATELRRLRAEVEADQVALRARQQELEILLAAAPARNWAEARHRVEVNGQQGSNHDVSVRLLNNLVTSLILHTKRRDIIQRELMQAE